MSELRVLVVEDEIDLAAGIRENLEAEGYSVEVVHDGAAGLDRASSGDHDLVVLDVMLPRMDGLAVCRELRARENEIPVLFLTALGTPTDRIRGLEEGGDDYLAKPFELRELLLRVAAIARRAAWIRRRGADERLAFGGNEVDLGRCRARDRDGTQHRLTHKEAMILRLLSEREGRIVSRDEILDVVWGYGSFPSTRTVDNFILRLRRRFESDPGTPAHFHTVHGAGYCFTQAPDPGTRRSRSGSDDDPAR